MTACDVLTPERLSRALGRRLSADEKRLLAAHLATACEGCLELLAGTDGAKLLEALAGPSATLSKAEQSEIFAAAFRPGARPARRPRAPRWALTLAAGVALAAVGGWMWQHQRAPEGNTLKGSVAVIETSLELFASGPPVRRLDTLAAGEAVLFRYRVSAPAHLYLFDAAGELLWSGPGSGESEVSDGKNALALPYERAQAARKIILLASPVALSEGVAREALSSGCRGCGRDEAVLER